MRYAVKLTTSSMRQTPFVAAIDQMYCLMWVNKGLTRTSLKYRVMERK